jgi:HAD superfamily hydrolase (TIGR01490 family)
MGRSATSKKFAAFDIDGTLFRSGLYREVVYELIRMGAVPERILTDIADKEMAWKHRTHGNAFAEFDGAIVDIFDKELPRIKTAYLDLAAERVIKTHKDNTYVYTRELARQLKSDGYFLIAISGSQLEVVEPFAQHYGFDTWVGMSFERGGDFFTGHIRKTYDGKGPILQKIIDQNKLSLDKSIAIGDSAGDIAMLEMVEQPIAFNPENNLYNYAAEKGWEIVLERKNMIYHINKRGDSYVLSKADSH